MTQRLRSTVGFIVAAALSAVLPQTLALAASLLAPASSALLDPSHLHYLGAIRTPSDFDTRDNFGNIAGRLVDGHPHVFIWGRTPVTGWPAMIEADLSGLTPNPDYRAGAAHHELRPLRRHHGHADAPPIVGSGGQRSGRQHGRQPFDNSGRHLLEPGDAVALLELHDPVHAAERFQRRRRRAFGSGLLERVGLRPVGHQDDRSVQPGPVRLASAHDGDQPADGQDGDGRNEHEGRQQRHRLGAVLVRWRGVAHRLDAGRQALAADCDDDRAVELQQLGRQFRESLESLYRASAAPLNAVGSSSDGAVLQRRAGRARRSHEGRPGEKPRRRIVGRLRLQPEHVLVQRRPPAGRDVLHIDGRLDRRTRRPAAEATNGMRAPATASSC